MSQLIRTPDDTDEACQRMYGMDRAAWDTYRESVLRFSLGNPLMAAVSILSDVQELLPKGEYGWETTDRLSEQCRQLINRAKALVGDEMEQRIMERGLK